MAEAGLPEEREITDKSKGGGLERRLFLSSAADREVTAILGEIGMRGREVPFTAEGGEERSLRLGADVGETLTLAVVLDCLAASIRGEIGTRELNFGEAEGEDTVLGAAEAGFETGDLDEGRVVAGLGRVARETFLVLTPGRRGADDSEEVFAGAGGPVCAAMLVISEAAAAARPSAAP